MRKLFAMMLTYTLTLWKSEMPLSIPWTTHGRFEPLPKTYQTKKDNNYWCRYKKQIPCPDKLHHLDSVLVKHLRPIYERLGDPALLARCLPGLTQNVDESVNSLA